MASITLSFVLPHCSTVSRRCRCTLVVMTPLLPEVFSLEDRVALVTGGNSGIGRAMADALADAGASVVVVGRNPSTLADVERAVVARGGRCAAIGIEIGDRDELDAALDGVASIFGEPDILVNAAGVNMRPPLGDLTVEQWDTTMAVNLTAPFLLGQRFGPAMAERGYGRIINLGSQQSFRAFGNSGGYGVAKAGVVALTRSQAEAWSRYGVCCNAIIPGFVRTAMTEEVFADEQRVTAMARRTMMGRNGTVDDFRGVVVFLASAASSFVTGQSIFVDGGFSST
jgi:NAD(P)-dependent dehydrogenase (short-subunit alcohol dehydrogenase family)